MKGKFKAIFIALLFCGAAMIGSLGMAVYRAWDWAIADASFRPVANWLALAALFAMVLWRWQRRHPRSLPQG